jgi:hypothetical protein
MMEGARCVWDKSRHICWFHWLGPSFSQKQRGKAAADLVHDAGLELIEP